MRTVEDALSLRQALKNEPKKALVVGASMVGIRIVELLHNAGVEVCLADLAPHIFPLAAHPDCAGIIEERLIQKGIKLRFGVGIQGLEEHSHGVRAYFSGGSAPEEADLAVICIGVRPNLDFIDKGQVETDKGILVDDYMRTSNPALYAAGDVAQGKNLLTGEKQIIGLWASARYQGRTAGRNMAGREDVYTGNIPHVITHFMDMVFAGLGDIRSGSREEVLREKDAYIHLAWDRERIVGVNMLNRCEGSGIIKNALHKSLITNTPLNQDNLSWNKLLESIYLKHFIRKGIGYPA